MYRSLLSRINRKCCNRCEQRKQELPDDLANRSGVEGLTVSATENVGTADDAGPSDRACGKHQGRGE